MSELENNLKAKIANMQEQKFRRQYDITMGVDGEAFAMNTPREPNMELSGRNRGRGVPPGYKYSQEELQAALDASNTENRIGGSIFDYVLQKTGDPRAATQIMNAAGFMPFVGTAMGAEDAYDAARDIPDAYRMNGIPGVLGQLGTVAVGAGDAALTMAPFAKTLMKSARNLPKTMRRAGDATSRGMFALEDMMTAPPPKNPPNALLEQVARYLESRG